MSAGLMNQADAQRVIYDRKHFLSVNENAVARHAAELTHNQYLEKIDQNLKTINLTVGSVVTAQSIIEWWFIECQFSIKKMVWR